MACRRVRLQRAPLHRVRLFGSLQEHDTNPNFGKNAHGLACAGAARQG